MAATRSFTRSAVAAAVIVLLSACGGGETPEQAQQPQSTAQTVAPSAVVQALNGKAVEARAKILAVSIPTSKSGFSLTADIKLAGTTEVRSQKQATTASAALLLTAKAENVLDWAEKNFKQFFPMEQVSQNACIPEGCFIFRYYPLTAETGNYLGIRTDGPQAGEITLYGQYVGYVITPFAHVDDNTFRCIADVNSCRPTVTSVVPMNDAIDVSAKGTSVVYTFGNGPISCAGIGGTSEVGDAVKVIVTVTCSSLANTVTIRSKDDRWPSGVRACMTLGGVQSGVPALTGYGSLPVTTCFTTRATVTAERLYVAKTLPEWTGEKAAAVLDGSTVMPVAFPASPGFNDLRNVAVDPLMGKAYFAGLGTYRLYSIDLETSQVLEPIAIDPDFQYSHAVQGLMVTESEVCMAFARADVQGYPRHNQLDCRSLTTGKQGFLSQRNFLAADGMLTTTLRYLPYGAEKKAYALATARDSYFLEVYDSKTGGIREGYLSGKAGVVTEVDMTTHQTKSWNVGSVPQGIDRDPTTGDLYVVNSGDRTLSIIRAVSGEVQTFSLASSFVGYQRPMRIKIDQARKRFYVTDYLGAVIAFNLADRREVARAPVGLLTIDLAYTPSGRLAVTSMEGTVVLLDLNTFTEVKRFSGIGLNAYGIASGQ